MLALGEYATDDLPPAGKAAPAIAEVIDDYKGNPDPGIHGASEWLLWRWGLTELFAAARKELAGRPFAQRKWFIDSRGFSYVVIESGVTFQMGTPEDEPDREQDQRSVRASPQRENSTFYAIATRPVTVAEFEEFLTKESIPKAFWPSQKIRKMSPDTDCPVINVSWLLAAAYCNYLSDRDGLRHCYPESILKALKAF